MIIKVRYLATLYDLIGTMKEAVEVPDGATVLDLIKVLDERHGGRLSREILDGDRLKDEYNVLVNGRAIDYLAGMATRLKDGDEVVFMPPVGGG
ncbi:MAG: ubiquitin-like small modifier protein 1 [Thermoproteus sp.]